MLGYVRRKLAHIGNSNRGFSAEAEGLPAAVKQWVRHANDPILVAGATGRIIFLNEAAAELLDADALPPSLADLVTKAATTKTSLSATHVVHGEGEKRLFQVECTPFWSEEGEHGTKVMVTARDTTLEANLTAALSESRRRFKELVECSVDFAWETDAEGRFAFVSKRGAMGFPAGWLEGTVASDLLSDDEQQADTCFFLTREPVSEEEMHLVDKDGRAATVVVCAVPIFHPDGTWAGARGVCRDITLVREHEQALREASEREKILASLISSIRDCIEPEKMLREASERIAKALKAPLCTVLRMERGNLTCAHAYESGAAKGLDTLLQYSERQVNRLAKDPEGAHHILSEMSKGGLLMMASLTRHDRQINGAICVARPYDRGPWAEKDRRLLEGVADYVGIAIAQMAAHEKLKRLSRTDELTGLLNRRGFQDHVEPRIKALRRHGQYGALIYVDLDYFKQVNDKFGHDRGDLVLRTLGIYMDGHTRGSDYCARIGGDEFAIWLDNTTREGAIHKAESLLKLKGELQQVAGATDPPLSMSLGLVLTDPTVYDDLNSLFDRADHAMYEAKKKGKSAFAIAEPIPIKKTG